MPPRSDEPRRDATGSRRGAVRGGTGRSGEPRAGQSRSGEPRAGQPRSGEPRPGEPRDGDAGGISDARAYTPRGRTIRESSEDRGGQRRTPRAGRSGDPFRPALQVLDGGRAAANRASRRQAAPTGRTGVIRTVPPRVAPDDDEFAEPPTPRRRPGRGAPRRGDAPGRGAPRRTETPRRTDRPAGRRPVRKPRRPPKLAEPRRRLRLGTVLVLAVFAVIGIRLVVLQAVDTPAYAGGGVDNRLTRIDLPAPRGSIQDRTGAPLARSVEARYVFADPTMVKDRTETAKLLSPLLGIPVSELADKMKRKGKLQFRYLARGVDIAQAKQIEALDLAGIGTHRDERREVPGGDLAANLVGFTSQDMDGLEGLEARYDDLLRGQDGRRVYEAGLGDLNAPIPGGYSQTTAPKPGSSLVLTIDRDLQFQVQQILSRQMAQTRGAIGAAVVLDVKTGDVLAQASNPTYNAASPEQSRPTDREDAATSFVVDPGSVHKAITYGAALQEGVITPDSAWPVANSITRGGVTFRDTHPADGKKLSVAGMLAYSSNVGTIEIGDRLGPDRLIDYQKRFGLGQPTGEGMPGEASGRLLPATQWSGSSYGSVPIGHSVDTTPLQMAAAYAAIANDGTYVQPHLIKEVVGADGRRTPSAAPVTRSVLSPQNAAALRTLLEAVTTVDGATGLAAAVPGYRVAGKTGTGLRYLDGKEQPGEVGSFIGMAPAEAPRYVVAVFVWNPEGGGGAVVAPAFREMMGFTLRHYRVPPSRGKSPNFEVFPR
ncbi:penicillin-binding protein 2 [Micromonospora sp. WMMD987]|uniref:peptidoglycan D,D-transpeptidase FtsI family protein n=1 Tax=Micromonospora TaxID=1873 RepID=UPI00249A1618|nr:penicillin-binding protein 2 [Micromonospora sp. WMMD987]WFE93977.1 penicillin-binding protein 2 [Micromonospora sp. WMMD987]